ncbi:MAG: MFS transporter [Archangiaceae bacterium]|nr:MFS transporter [Archangiaceae bacterium]
MKGARFGLAALCLINLLNYVDRYILAGVMDALQTTFSLNDTQGGQLATIFMVVYMCASPLGGYLGDRMPRRYLIGLAVLVWSAATIGSGLATSFGWLLVARAVTGIGEAGYGTVAPSVISDLFKKEQRSRMLAYFYTAMPLGAAVGFVVGGAMESQWHHAFFVGGAPGLVLGVLAFFLPEPKRGAMDDGPPPTPVPFAQGLAALRSNARYWYVVAGLTLMTFSIGGLSIWMPKYLHAERAFTRGEAGLALGVTTVIGGLVGTLAGGIIGDRLDKRRPGSGVLLSACGLLTAAPFMVGAVLLHDRYALLACLLLAQVCIFLNNGPLNAALVNVVSPGLRSFAFGISMLVLHLLGDAASPTLIGWLSDHSSLGTAILVNAVPVAVGGLILLPAVKLFRLEPPSPSSSAP